MQWKGLHHEVVDAGRSVDDGCCLDIKEAEGGRGCEGKGMSVVVYLVTGIW